MMLMSVKGDTCAKQGERFTFGFNFVDSQFLYIHLLLMTQQNKIRNTKRINDQSYNLFVSLFIFSFNVIKLLNSHIFLLLDGFGRLFFIIQVDFYILFFALLMNTKQEQLPLQHQAEGQPKNTPEWEPNSSEQEEYDEIFSSDTESENQNFRKLQSENGEQDAKEAKEENQLIDKKKEPEKKQEKNSKELKRYDYDVDPKIQLAIIYLFKYEVKCLMNRGQGYMLISKSYSPGCIQIYYYDDEVLERVDEKLTEFIDEICLTNIDKRDVEKGYHLSFWYQKKLREQKLTIFKYRRRSGQSYDYYLCGKVPTKVLLNKVLEIKKSQFSWLLLYEFYDTRTYRKLLEKVFQKLEFRRMMQKKFNVLRVQVVCGMDSHAKKQKKKFNNLQIIMTLFSKTRLIHQDVDESISNFIKNNYYIITFFFKRKSFNEREQPPVNDDFNIFCIHESHNIFSYLCLIVEKSSFVEKLPLMIQKIKELKLNISGRRFFKGIHPQLEKGVHYEGFRLWKHPPIKPYSWTKVPDKVEVKFNWEKELVSLGKN